MLREVLFSYGLISWNILTINDISLPHLHLAISLGLFHLNHLGSRPSWQRIKNILIGGFIIDLFMSEIKMCFPKLMFHFDIVLVPLARG